MRKVATKIALLYFVIGSVWILVSDRIAHELLNANSIFHSYKGILFILTTAFILWQLINRYEKKQRKINEQLQHLNRVYNLVNSLNDAIVNIKDKTQLFHQICNILVQEGNYVMAWIGEIDEIRNVINVIASAGDTKDYLTKLNINLYDNISSGGPTGTCIKTGKAVISNDIATDPKMVPWRDNAIKYGYRSSAGFPLTVKGIVIGNLNIYSNEKYFFNAQEEQLISSVINNISQALNYMAVESERANDAKALAESEERLRLSLSSSKQGLFDLNLQTGEAIVNEEYTAMLGYNYANFKETYDSWRNRLHPNDVERCDKTLTDYLKGHSTAYNVEFRQKTADNKWIWIFSSGKIVSYDETGKPIRMLGTHTNIDLLKQSEQALNERIKEMTCISAIRLEMLKDWTVEGFINKVLEIIVPGMQFPEATLPVVQINNTTYQLKAASYATLKYLEAPITILGEELGWLKVYYDNRNLSFIEPEEQELINNIAVSIGLFVSNKINQEKLNDSLHILQEAQEVANIGHYTFDLQNDHWKCSPVIDKMLGIEPNFERNFKNWLEKLVAPRFQQSIKEELADLMQMGTIFQLDFAGVHQITGEELWVTITGRFERDAEGKIIELIGTVQDITERKKAQELIEKTNNQLQATLSAIPDLMFEVDIDGVYLDVYATNESLLYISKDDILGKKLTDLLPTDMAAICMKAIQEANKKGISTGSQILLPVPAGLCWFELSITKKKDIIHEKISFVVLSRDITNRKTVQQQLEQEKNVLRTVIDNIPDFIFVTDKDCKHIINNMALVKALGATSEAETLNRSMDEFYPKEMADIFIADDRKVIDTGVPVINREEKVTNFTTGKTEWLLTTKIPLKNRNNEISGVVGISRMITERHQQQNEQRLVSAIIQALGYSQTLQDGLTTALQILSEELNIPFAEAWMVTTDETEMKTFATWGVSEVAKYFDASTNRIFKKGEGLPGYVWETQKSVYWDDIQVNPLVRRAPVFKAAGLLASIAVPIHFKGKVIAVFSFFFKQLPLEKELIIQSIENIALQIAMDIQRKKAELELAVFFEFSPDLVCIATNDGYFLKVNPAFTNLLGYTAEELTSKPFNHFVHPDDKVATEKRTGYSVSYHSIHFENRYVAKDGKVVWLSWTSAPLPDEKLIIAVAKDVSALKENERQLKLLNDEISKRVDELAASNAELEQFAYVASHDLQEPLRMVSSFMTLLETKYKDQLDEKAQQYIHFAVDGAVRMRKIILDLLEYSRVGRIIPPSEQVDLIETLNDIILVLKQSITETKATITWDEMPTIFIAKTSIQHILQNLISNGLKYQQEGVQPIVHISATETDTHWQFAVTDNGIGIEPKYFDKIFVLFQRLHGKTEYSGTGIGLAICKKMVEWYKGKIWVTSTPGVGSTFYFTIAKTNTH
jgi:PAS domain S-box-containing protein